MVGAGTACADNPRLTVRLVEGKDPLRVVVDSTLRLPLDAAVLSDGAACGTVLAVTGLASEARCEEAASLGATVLRLPDNGEDRVDLRELLAGLWEIGVRSVMVEGGAALITALFCERLADRLAVCIAPKILGSGVEAVGELGICNLEDSIQLKDASVIPYGEDLILDGRLTYPDGN